MTERIREIFRRLLTTHAAWPVLASVGMLCATSVLALRAVGKPGGVDWAGRQEWYILFGVAAMLVMMLPHYEWLGRMAYPFMIVVTGLLVLVRFTDPINNSRRWFSVNDRFQVQPSELAKIAFVLALGWYLRYRRNVRELTGLVVPVLLMLVPCALILVEPDLSTALLFPLVLYAMLIAAGARLRHLLTVAVLAVVMAPGAYPLLLPYQQARVKSVWVRLTHAEGSRYLQEERRGPDYQATMSKVAIASGGTLGGGADKSAGGQQGGADLVRRGILPEAHTDFIFAVIGSQWGFAGTALVVLLYVAFLAAGLEIAASTKDPFGRLVAVGIVSMVLFQTWINMAMTLGLLPVVGVTLPFVSYGGSSLVTNMLAAGILLNISVRRKTRTTRLSPEFAAA